VGYALGGSSPLTRIAFEIAQHLTATAVSLLRRFVGQARTFVFHGGPRSITRWGVLETRRPDDEASVQTYTGGRPRLAIQRGVFAVTPKAPTLRADCSVRRRTERSSQQ
jgi:hypothetical protein